MDVTDTLFASHRARFASVDRLLPEPPPPPDGEPLAAAVGDGTKVAALLQHRRYPPGSADLLWSAAEVWQLFPYVGETGTEGMDALLRAWRQRLDDERPGHDSACLVTWPSRDAEAIRAFLDHGLVPLSVLAIRSGPAEAHAVEGVTVRRAHAADFDQVLAQVLATFDYSGLVAGGRRPDTAELVSPWLRRKLDSGGRVWLAERDGMAGVAGTADADWIESAPGSWVAELLPHGRWGYVNNVVTTPAARGGGVGQAMMSVVHEEFHAVGAKGTYLYYNPTNPLSSVFWHRQGYRPLWTLWEVRPAGALR
ncbi:GNAT family N-acetyltransferase [Amycolatopsis nigrescens]|uniref:GNAT family N-acetyltransferase n=1 Tax=Amycolatopsis nigrescens TaxID=381445 RepID=UPI0003656E9E|nr:GNAT family N-acetyltransferase [Amycolatopsis nigrescens]